MTRTSRAAFGAALALAFECLSSLAFALTPTPYPSYLVPQLDATYGRKVTRICNNTGRTLLTGTWSTVSRHHYSKDQAWTADGRRLAIQVAGGAVFLDAGTYAPLPKCSSYSAGDDRWHPALGSVRINVRKSSGTTPDPTKDYVQWFDMANCTELKRIALPFTPDYFGPSEGNVSFDGRYIALLDTRSPTMYAIDMNGTGRVGPPVRLDDPGDAGLTVIDWVSISPAAKFCVVHFQGDYNRVYDFDPVSLAMTPHPYSQDSVRCMGTGAAGFIYDLGHPDMTIYNGDDVIVGQEHCNKRLSNWNGRYYGSVIMVRLKDGAVTALTRTPGESQAHHVSTRNYNLPGWCFVSYRHDSPTAPFSDEIVQVPLDASGNVVRWGATHTDYEGYYSGEAHVEPNRDGTKVMFASNWMYNCSPCGPSKTDVKSYVIDAPLPPNDGGGDGENIQPLLIKPRYARTVAGVVLDSTILGTGLDLQLQIPKAGHVELTAYDVGGRRIRLLNGDFPAGARTYRWDTRRLPSGVYFLHLVTPGAAPATAEAVVLH